MSDNIIVENALYRYNVGYGWCKHGIVYTVKKNGVLYAIDTYWDSRFDGTITDNKTIYKAEDIFDNLEFIMMIKDAKEIDGTNYCMYNDEEKIYIPCGGWHERYLVNKNANPDVRYVQEHIEYLLNENLNKITCLKKENERLQDWKKRVYECPEISKKYDANYVWEVDYALSRTVK